MIDLSQVQNVLAECDKAIVLLHQREGQDTPDLNEDRTTNAERRREVAEMSRELIRLADNLALASVLVRNEYHILKGANDALAPS